MKFKLNEGQPNEIEHDTNNMTLILIQTKPMVAWRPGMFKLPIDSQMVCRNEPTQEYFFIHNYNNKVDIFEVTQEHAMKMCREAGYGLHQMQEYFPALNQRRFSHG